MMHGQKNIKTEVAVCSQKESTLKVTNLFNSFSLKLLLLIREIIQECQLNNTRCNSTSGNLIYHLL